MQGIVAWKGMHITLWASRGTTLQEDEKRCRFAATTTRFKACPTSALTSPRALYTDTLHTAPAITATISLRPRSNVMYTIAVVQIQEKIPNTKREINSALLLLIRIYTNMA